MSRVLNQVLKESKRPKEIVSNQGGIVFKASDATKLERFLILGSFGSFYASERDMSAESIKQAQGFVNLYPGAALSALSKVMSGGLAYRRDPSLLVLAMLTLPTVPLNVRRAAVYLAEVNIITGTDFLHWVDFRNTLSGGKWNRLSQGIIKNWFLNHRSLELQAVKYDQRDGWTMRDALRIGHPHPGDNVERAGIIDWMAHPDKRGDQTFSKYRLLSAYRTLRMDGMVPELAARVIREQSVPREAVPSELLAHAEVWAALLDNMPGQALLRNLGKLSSVGALDNRVDEVVEKILKSASRQHPVAFLVAYQQYGEGHGLKGKLSWNPNDKVLAALERAYVDAFEYLDVFPNVRPLIAVDVSGSMGSLCAGLNMSALEAEVCVLQVLLKQFPNAKVMSFSMAKSNPNHSTFGGSWWNRTDNYDYLDWHAFTGKESRKDIFNSFRKLGNFMSGTDLTLPLRYALEANDVDCSIVMTDNEHGGSHDVPELMRKIQHNKPEFRNAVLSFSNTNSSVADPNDPHQLDVVGMSADVPRVIADFMAGKMGAEKN
jgi:60 kDa SS-A/Ro ribonucleoprotein